MLMIFFMVLSVPIVVIVLIKKRVQALLYLQRQRR